MANDTEWVRVHSRAVMVALAVVASLMLMVHSEVAIGKASHSTSSGRGELSWRGGPVLHSSAPYLVFWTPSGETIPASSEELMTRFFSDLATGSGKSSNVFAVDRQYYDGAGFADYRQSFNAARQVIVDTQKYPPNSGSDCPVTSAYPTCVSDSQIQDELQRLITADRLPKAGTGNPELVATAPIYFVVLPADVNFCEGGILGPGPCINNKVCAYHSWFASHGSAVLYAAQATRPLRDGSLLFADPKGDCLVDNTNGIQMPNGDPADLAIDGLSHEYSETITDPMSDSAWFNVHGAGVDAAGQEGGDECEFTGPFSPATGYNPDAFLPTLGGTQSARNLFTQLINGHRYYLQSEWSDGASNCQMRPSPGRIVPRFSVSPVRHTVHGRISINPVASTSRFALSSATWTFGDGSRAFFSARSTLTSVTYRYRRPGRYSVTLTLVDDRGNIQTTTRRILVRAQ